MCIPTADHSSIPKFAPRCLRGTKLRKVRNYENSRKFMKGKVERLVIDLTAEKDVIRGEMPEIIVLKTDGR